MEQSAQDSGEQGTDTTGTEFEQVEGVNTDQKLIKTVNMSAETTEFDALVADVREKRRVSAVMWKIPILAETMEWI